MTVKQIIDYTNFDEIDIDPSQLEFKTNFVDGNRILSGYFLKGTNELAGIGRKEWKNSNISEGFYLNNKLNGFGRYIWSNGTYYIGEFKNFNLHGKGKRVYADGRIKEGRWENGHFIGPQ